MNEKKITNPIYKELLKYKLIDKKNILKISNKTKDKRISVLKDKKTNIIFLSKYETDLKYYKKVNYKDHDRKLKKKSFTADTYVKSKDIKENTRTNIFIDDLRRYKQFKKHFVNKDFLDFGCGWGGFLSTVKNTKFLNGVELRKECTDYIAKNHKKFNVKNDINLFNKKFDIITAFHVLEHIPFQVKTLKKLGSKLKKNGKIIIEVPHAEDFLILQKELQEFKHFTFWSEHLILHTEKSLRTTLRKAGFKNIKIDFFQRFNLNNHLGWFLKKKPGGHEFFSEIASSELNQEYCKNLIRLKKTDTLIATAEK